MIIASFLFSWGNYWINFLALAVVLLSAFVDFADGVVWRAKNLSTPLGAWLDPALDSVSQLLILFGICVGVVRLTSGSLFWSGVCLLALFALSANDLITQHFNRAFGFDSYLGLPEFSQRVFRSKKIHFIDICLYNVIAPSNPFFIFLFTLRYFVILGIVFNLLSFSILFFAIFSLLRAIIMYFVYALTLLSSKSEFKVVEVLKQVKIERKLKS